MEDTLLVAPMECHARYLTTPNPRLPEHLASVARAFIEPARALAHHDLKMFERLIAPDRAMECPPDVTLMEVLDGLPACEAKSEALLCLRDAQTLAQCGKWSKAVWMLFHAKNAACVALVK